MKFTYLPGSLAEADTIKARRNMKGDLLLTGSDVTEQQFCELAPKYPIVNISTHGFFGAASTPMGTRTSSFWLEQTPISATKTLTKSNVTDFSLHLRCRLSTSARWNCSLPLHVSRVQDSSLPMEFMAYNEDLRMLA